MTWENAAARDLWAQMFERAAAEPDAALHEPDEESEAEQRELTVRALKEAGWSDAEIKNRISATHFQWELENANSPGVGPGLEFKLKLLSDRVRDVISQTGETSHSKVEVAIDPKVGVSASLINVILTDEGILSVSSFLFRWCGVVAKAYTRTLLVDIPHWTSQHPDPAADRRLLIKHPELLLYWFRIFASFCATGTHILVPYRPASPKEIHLVEQVAWSMEYFTVAHEFGHHVLAHRNVEDDPKVQEFEADAFAVKICEKLEFEPFPRLSNPYTRTGAGASLMLLALEILRSFESPTATTDSSDTHPSTNARILKISQRNLMQPRQLEMDCEFNNTVARIMSAVGDLMLEARHAGGDDLVAMIQQSSDDVPFES